MNAVPPPAPDVLLTLDPTRFAKLGAFLLELYRDGREVDPARFCAWAFERLRQVLRFDSGMWGHGHANPVDIHDVYVDGQPPEMMRNYAHHQKDDFFAVGCNERPMRTVNLYDLIDRAGFVRLPIYRRHARRFGMEHILCTVVPEPDSGLISFVSLWRARYADPYDEADRAIKQFLMPHLVEARRQNVIERLRRSAIHDRVGGQAAAVCDPRGVLHECTAELIACLRTEWPQWHGPRLPDPLIRAITRTPRGGLDVERHRFEWLPFEQRLYVRARPLHPVDRLSRRERQVAKLLMEGCTHKEVAKQLGVTPNTARSHIIALYRRLGVSNKAQMARMVTEHADDAGEESPRSVPRRRRAPTQ